MRLRFVPRREFDRVLALGLGPPARTALIADLARINTLYMIERAGSGHLGSSFSSLDIVTWLWLEVLDHGLASDGFPRDLFFSSKGHDAPGLYAVLTGVGALPFELVHQLRRHGGLPGHPDIATPGIVCNTGSLGMGISKAKGMVLARRLRGERGRVFVMTGDGELQEGQIWESLQPAAENGMSEITVIVDHNKLQSDTAVELTSPLGDLERKFSAFGWRTTRCDGHDAAQLATALAALGRTAGALGCPGGAPRILIADTIKGRGVSFMEPGELDRSDRLYRFHSGAPSLGDYERALAELGGRVDAALGQAGARGLELEAVEVADRAPPAGERLIDAYGAALVDVARRRDDVVVLDGDLALDCGLLPFRREFPDRFFECGIAEQDMVSMASGMARMGCRPIVHSFACFLSTRPNEQIYNNATEGARILYVGSLAGLVPAGPGHSHQSVRDISCLAGTPGLALVEPCCAAEVAPLLEWALEEAPAGTYLRLVSVPCEVPYRLPEGYRPVSGRGVLLRPGAAALLVGYGPVLLAEAWRAAERLAREDQLEVAVVNLPWLDQVDLEWLRELVAGHSTMVTLDNHYINGAQGQRIAAALQRLGAHLEVRHLGLDRVPVCAANDHALALHGLDAEHIAGAVRQARRKDR